jgi:hypothetical protein
LAPFSSEGSRQSKLFWASLRVQGLEQANQAFSYAGFVHVINRECLDCQKSPAPIPVQGLF